MCVCVYVVVVVGGGGGHAISRWIKLTRGICLPHNVLISEANDPEGT